MGKHAKDADLRATGDELASGRAAGETIDELVEISPHLAIIESFRWLEAARSYTERAFDLANYLK